MLLRLITFNGGERVSFEDGQKSSGKWQKSIRGNIDYCVHLDALNNEREEEDEEG